MPAANHWLVCRCWNAFLVLSTRILTSPHDRGIVEVDWLLASMQVLERILDWLLASMHETYTTEASLRLICWE